jgi:hypothetical protein
MFSLSREEEKTRFTSFKIIDRREVYHRERILGTSTLSCNEEEEEITKPPTR